MGIGHSGKSGALDHWGTQPTLKVYHYSYGLVACLRWGVVSQSQKFTTNVAHPLLLCSLMNVFSYVPSQCICIDRVCM